MPFNNIIVKRFKKNRLYMAPTIDGGLIKLRIPIPSKKESLVVRDLFFKRFKNEQRKQQKKKKSKLV